MASTGSPSSKRFLFVCGAPRNGTTALAELVGAHDRIALGVERFKELWATDRIDEFVPALFDRGRFFDFSDGLTNITPAKAPKWDEYYRGVADKFSSAEFVGDKVMRPQLESIVANFPAAELLCIIRHPHGVASSWDRRAKNPRDAAWPASWDARASLSHWNRMIQAIARARQEHPDHVSVVRFDTVFERRRPLQAFVRRLGLEWDDSIEVAFARTRSQGVKLRGRDRTVPDDVKRALDEGADWSTWELLTNAADIDSNRAAPLPPEGDRAASLPSLARRLFDTIGSGVRTLARGGHRR